MILITGGAYQGKGKYAEQFLKEKNKNVIDGENCELNEIFEADAVHNFHLYIKRMLEKDEDVSGLAEQLYERNPKCILITNEIGCGLVPADPFERRYRETAGRVCCQIAERAGEVHRVTCGIGQIISKRTNSGKGMV